MKSILGGILLILQLYIFIADRYEPGFLKLDLLWGFRFFPLLSHSIPSCTNTVPPKIDATSLTSTLDNHDLSTLEFLSLLGLPYCKESKDNVYTWKNITFDGHTWSLMVEFNTSLEVSNVRFVQED